MNELTTEQLRELLDYDPETGRFTNRVARSKCKVGESPERQHCEGYLLVSLDNRKYLAHRLAWLHVHGKWPDHDIDHIDMDRKNNRISNLRDVSRATNQQNVREAKSSNLSCGLLGVSFCSQTGRWAARIRINGKKTHLGRFDTPLLAHEAYVNAKRALHPGNTL